MSEDDLKRDIRAMAEGDQTAFARVYDATHRQVWGVVLRVLGDAALAEEVTTDVYMEAWRKASRYEPTRGGPRTWLLILARCRALDRLRSVGPRRARECPLDAASDVVGPDADPGDATASDEHGARVRAALKTLPDAQREALELAFLGGLTHTEIAARLDAPLGTVKTRIRLAMRKLHEVLLPLLEVA